MLELLLTKFSLVLVAWAKSYHPVCVLADIRCANACSVIGSSGSIGANGKALANCFMGR